MSMFYIKLGYNFIFLQSIVQCIFIYNMYIKYYLIYLNDFFHDIISFYV